jgi:hypothetical protein
MPRACGLSPQLAGDLVHCAMTKEMGVKCGRLLVMGAYRCQLCASHEQGAVKNQNAKPRRSSRRQLHHAHAHRRKAIGKPDDFGEPELTPCRRGRGPTTRGNA